MAPERTIKGPDWEWGTDKDAAAWLRWELTEFKRAVAKIGMRPGMRQSRQVYYWSRWQVALLSELAPYLDLEAHRPGSRA